MDCGVNRMTTHWPTVILHLRSGPNRLTYREIADRVGVHHATIQRLAYEISEEPAHSVGEALLRLHAEMRQPERV